MGAHNFDDLRLHVGHKIECVEYGGAEVVNVAVECVTCSEVLVDYDAVKAGEAGCPLCGAETDTDSRTGFDEDRMPVPKKYEFCTKCDWESEDLE